MNGRWNTDQGTGKTNGSEYEMGDSEKRKEIKGKKGIQGVHCPDLILQEKRKDKELKRTVKS